MNLRRKLLAVDMRYPATILVALPLSVPVISSELFRYQAPAKDGPPMMHSHPFYPITYLIKEEIRKHKWIEGLMVGCLYSFLLAERDDLATGRYVNDPHYVVVEVVNREEDEETDDEYDKEDPDWWKE
jgi:hypothetical protein